VTGGIATLTEDDRLRAEIESAARVRARPCTFAKTVEELEAIARRCDAIVIDHEHAEAGAALRAALRVAGSAVVLSCIDRELERAIGAHAIVARSLIGDVVRSLDAERAQKREQHDRLLAVSVLDGPLDRALDNAAAEIASSFDTDRCLISTRGDSASGGANATQTWSAVAWDELAAVCRSAAATGATVICAGDAPKSVLSVKLESANGRGFMAIIANGARVFASDTRDLLAALAVRIGGELAWRAAHEHTANELDRLSIGPGIDGLLGVWNRPALAHLLTMYVSAAERSRHPLTVAVLDVVDLQSVNAQHGLETGDRVLRRIADALRATLRTEDLVGRSAGDEIAAIFPSTAIDGAQRIIERIKAALEVRPIELAPNASASMTGTCPIRVKYGLALLQQKEDPMRLLARATQAVTMAPEGGLVIAASVNARSQPRISSQIEVSDELRGLLGGTYRLLHEISRGGMGVVYRAEDLALERPVAIKMLRPDLAEDQALVESLRSEAALLARIQHPNLVQVYSFGQVGGDSYIVMELVEGEGLRLAIDRHRIEGDQFQISDALQMIDEIASALDALHDLGIIHRDVKPENVIRDPFRNRSVLVDVGIARRFGQFVESAGTPGFVAPEVIRGEEATPRSDLYGLAATAYATLTLADPWEGSEGVDVLARQVHGEEIPLLSTFRDELVGADDIMARALSTDPLLRPTTAGEFARALREALAITTPAAASPRFDGRVVWPRRVHASVPKTRGVVFRSLPRALGAREAGKLRDAIGGSHPFLARTIADAAPLEWLPTSLVIELLALAPAHVGRDAASLAQDIARATVRATFRRFFPASAATLVPERTIAAVRNIWSRYQTWGLVSSMPVRGNESVVRIAETLKEPDLCAWTRGMLEQLVTLSGGTNCYVDHEACETRNDPACLYRVTWERTS
jgi:diguanylate cyclase (GGDEF)-like protein